MTDPVPWLRKLATQGGKGTVNNIDARSLGGIADLIEQLRNDKTEMSEALQHCLREHGGYTIKGETERIARAAIAKATEGSP